MEDNDFEKEVMLQNTDDDSINDKDKTTSPKKNKKRVSSRHNQK